MKSDGRIDGWRPIDNRGDIRIFGVYSVTGTIFFTSLLVTKPPYFKYQVVETTNKKFYILGNPES